MQLIYLLACKPSMNMEICPDISLVGTNVPHKDGNVLACCLMAFRDMQVAWAFVQSCLLSHNTACGAGLVVD